MTIWRGSCGVCNTLYQHPENSREKPNATFCPDCRERGMMAPGVVNWIQHIESKDPTCPNCGCDCKQ